MKYYLDTEFIEDGITIDLISIGLVAKDGRSLYLQNSECDFSQASDWVWENVFHHLAHFHPRGKRKCRPITRRLRQQGKPPLPWSACDSAGDCPWRSREEIAAEVLTFCDPEKYGKPEFWGYYADYDWVAFCQLFGTMIQLPKGFPMYCRDIKQICDDLGNPELPPQVVSTEHHALSDALWTKKAHEFLLSLKK